MPCNSCSKRREGREQAQTNPVKGPYKYLDNNQLMARLELYKKRYCKNCDKISFCDYGTYVVCKGVKE